MTVKPLSWEDRGQLGDSRAISHKIPSRQYCIRALGSGCQLMMYHDVDPRALGQGWVLIAAYDDPFDARDAAAYYDFWGRLPNHIPRSAS